MAMQHANAFLGNLAVVLCVAAATTVLFHRLRQPVVLGYILAGLIVGPYVPVPLVADRAIVQELSELRVLPVLLGTAGKLLLFLLAVVALGMLLVPRFVRFTLKLGRRETTVVACVGICFAGALLAHRFGYSVALGAFLAGSLVAESGEGERV